MRISWVLPNQHEVCQPNRKPLSSLFGDTMAYHTYRGYGGKREIRTHGTFLFFGFQDRCNKPDSASFPYLVVVLGIEPRIEESKSSVLPLHYTTTWSRLLESNQYQMFTRHLF